MNCYLPWNLKDMTSISSEKLQKNIKQQTSYIDLYRTELMKESLRFNIASLLRHVCLNRESFGTDELSKKATDCLLVFLHATVALKNSYFAPTDVENPAVGKCAKNLHRLMVENVKSTMRYIDYSVLLDYAHGRITEDEILDQRIKIHAEVFPEEETFNVCTNEKVNDAFFTLVDLETVKAKFFVDFDVQRNADIEDELCRRLSLIPRSYDKFASSQYGVIGETKPYVNTPFIKYGGNYYSFVTTYALNLISPVVEEFYPEQEEEDQYVIEDETPIDETPVEEVPELVPAPMVQPEEPEPEIQEDIPQPEEPVPAIDPEPQTQERPAESEEDSEYEEPEEELEEDLEEDDVEEEETEEEYSEEPEFEDDEFEADPDEDEEELEEEEEEPEEDEFEDTESDEEDPYELSDDDTETEQDAEDAPEEEAEPEVEDQEEPAELFENPDAEKEDEIPFDEPEMTEATSDEEDDEEFLDEPKPEPAADRPVEPQPVLIPTSAYNPYDDSDDDDFEEVADNDSLRSSEDSAYTETDEYAYPDEFEEDNSNSLEAAMEEEEVYEVSEDQDDEDSEKASFPDEPYYDEEPYTALVSPDTYAYLDEAKATEFADSQVFQDADDEDAYEDDFDDPDEPQDVEEPDPYGGESLFSIADDDDDDTVHPEEETSEQTESIFTDNTDEEEQLPEPEPEPEAPVVEEPVAEPEPEPEPVVEPEPEPEPAPAKPATLPLLEQILQFSPSKNNPITQYLNGCSEEQKIDIVKTIEQARKKWLIDGKGKMFTIPDTNISIALFSETQDPMEAIQRAENIGAVMYALQKDSWNSLELSYDPAGQLSKADFKRISRSNFSDWEWKVVEKIGMRLIERRGK